jgi:hypothetical protein
MLMCARLIPSSEVKVLDLCSVRCLTCQVSHASSRHTGHVARHVRAYALCVHTRDTEFLHFRDEEFLHFMRGVRVEDQIHVVLPHAGG